MSWYPNADRSIKGNSAGSYTGGPFKGIFHTTEGGSPAGAIGAFKANNSWPHFLIDYTGKVWQFVSTNVSARTLRNLYGGAQTNRDSAIQLEIVGFAGRPNEHPVAQIDAVREIMRWSEKTHGIKPMGPGRPFATAYGQNQLRFTSSQWDNFNGWCGHCHVPENCVTPDARVLMADLTWKRAGSLVPGDEIIGFDEEPVLMQTQGNRELHGRQYRTGIVEENIPFIGKAVEVITQNGQITTTPGHPWLIWQTANGKGKWVWRNSDELEPGDQVAWFNEPWTVPQTREVGWLSGMYDADGCMALNNKGQNYCMELAQRSSESVALDKAQSLLKEHGIDSSLHIRPSSSGLGDVPMGYLRVLGGRPAIMRALGIIRPDRFIRSNYKQLWEGLHFKKGSTVHFDTIVSVEDRPDQPMAGIQTSLGTYIVEGWPMHQTHWDPGVINLESLLPTLPSPGFIVPADYLTEVPPVPFTVPRVQGGYIVVGPDGGVFTYDGAPFFGSIPGLGIQTKVVGAAWTPTGSGYWILGEDGGVFSFGDAEYKGGFNALDASTRGNRKPIGIVCAGNGYKIIAIDPSNDNSPFDYYGFGI